MSLSTAQKALLRTNEQKSRLYLAIFQPKTVFACQINDTFSSNDMVTEFEWDSATTGAYTDVLAGMTAFVGSSAGAYDVGIFRIRKALGATTIYCGETSEITFEDDLYITVIDAFDPWAKPLVVDENEAFYMDVDIAYDDQHENFDPVPTIGGNVVLDIESYPVAITFPDVANSWVLGDTIASYSFTATDGVVTDGTTTNPTLTISSYPTDGYIRVALTVTSTTGGKSFTRYGYVLIYDSDHRPISDFTLDSCRGDEESGGWSAEVTLNDDSDVAMLRYRGLAIIYSKDYFDGSPDYVGLHVDRENIWVSGWIFQNTDTEDPEFSPHSFEIQGANFWLQRMPSFPVGVELNSTASWTGIPLLTVDKGLFHLLHWRTTLTAIMDVYLTNDDKYTASCESAGASIWSQLVAFAQPQIFAVPRCDYNNRLYVLVPYNLVPEADRDSVSTLVMALNSIDYVRSAEIRWSAPQTGKLFLSGVIVSQGGTGSPLFSLSPGHVPGYVGNVEVVDNLLLESQSQSNSLAGLYFANKNNPYPEIPLTLHGNNRAFDIAPLLYATITLTEFTGTILPAWIEYTHDRETGKNTVEIGFKAATSEAQSTNGDIPVGDGTFITPGIGAFPGLPKFNFTPPDLPLLDFPGLAGGIVTDDCADYINNMFSLSWSKSQIDAGLDSDLSAIAYFPCTIRAAGSFAQTSIKINGLWAGDSKNHYAVYGIRDGNRVIAASVTHNTNGNIASFSPTSNIVVDGFELAVEEGFGSVVTYSPGTSVSSGSVFGTDDVGATIATIAGNPYSIECTEGPYQQAAGDPEFNSWTFKVDGTGLLGYYNHSDAFFLTLPSGHLFAEAVDEFHARSYFVAGGSSINFKVGDTIRFDNSGSLGWLLRNATIAGRTVILGPTTLYNVCAI